MTVKGTISPRTYLLRGRYELLSLIASGGMGQVWRGRDTLLGRPVAIKLLRSGLTGDPTFLPRFRAEAQHAAMLNHPNIAAVYDYGEEEMEASGELVAFLVMELVAGQALATLLGGTSRPGVSWTLSVVGQAASALAAAHEAGVIHRDVKPGNVLVRTDGIVKITDFGIAWSASSAPLTGTGQVVGTAHYLSPEQAQGAKASPASDVYSLGVVAYECLTGRRPFDGENSVQIALKQICEEPKPLPPDVPAAVRRLVAQAMAKDPAERIPDGASFRAAVDRVRAEVTETPPIAVAALVEPVPPPPATGRAGTAVLPTPVTGAAAAPTTAGETPSARGDQRAMTRRGSRGWLVPAVAVAALVLLAATLFGLVHRTGSPSTPAAGTTPRTSASASAPGSAPAPARVTVDAATLVGHPVGQVQAQLTGLRLVPRLAPIQTASVPDGTVIAVAPTGALDPGQAVTVTYAVAPPAAQGGNRGGNGDGGDGGD